MIRRLTRLLAFGAAAIVGSVVGADDLPILRVAVLQIGTVNWELETIRRHGFDRAHGFHLTVQPYADSGATRVALAGGTADVALADWIWVARQRAAGKDYVFVPYSKAVGGLVVPAKSNFQTLADLRGHSIGIAGGPLDKSWLILRAYAEKRHKMDLVAETEQVFGAPPLMFKLGISGETDAVINYWHFLAKMKTHGMREVISVAQATGGLGLDPDMPLLGYVMKESLLRDNPELAQALYDASRDAKSLLAADDGAWVAIRPMMNAHDDNLFGRLQEDFLAGIPPRTPVDTAEAARLLALMADLGGKALVGRATTLPRGLFADVD